MNWRDSALPCLSDPTRNYLPFGNGRSYGDSCLTPGGVLLDARGLDRFMAFDPATGILRCEAGVLLSEILAQVVPRGWFLPVVPGTQFVTVGGAIANDIHGKNHHRAGTFGCHVRCFEILRSDGQRLRCSPAANPEWFRATIGGLGLTGVILWAEIALKRISNAATTVEVIRFPALAKFFELSAESDRDFEYTVAWIDCMAPGNQRGRGLFMRANHAPAGGCLSPKAKKHRVSIPVDLPVAVINRWSARVFDSLHYHQKLNSRGAAVVHYEPFFFPLDGIGYWNRLYGRRGFFQYQCVVRHTEEGRTAIEDILQCAAGGQSDSFFGVLKVFGNRPSPGRLSFPRPGITLALDFLNRGKPTLDFLERLDQIVAAAGGAVNPSKDARMSAASFKRFYPNWEILENLRDPRFSSGLWQRVTQE
ncbi:MAG: FAD-binding oxidoreductase [Desulfobacterales bacterium]|nr:MAG: FAD-binding oxidoreductase [Desulfobacterales bacterium]